MSLVTSAGLFLLKSLEAVRKQLLCEVLVWIPTKDCEIRLLVAVVRRAAHGEDAGVRSGVWGAYKGSVSRDQFAVMYALTLF